MESQDIINKKIEQFRKVLQLSSEEMIVSSLESIRENGEDYMVQPIIELLFSPINSRTKEIIVSFLADLKGQNSAQIIIDCINNYINHKDLHYLVSVCWQSRLNFNQYIDIFIDLLCNADLNTGIEAFSTIENMLESLDQNQRNNHAQLLKRKYSSTSNNAELIKSLIIAIEEYKDEPDFNN